MKRLLLLCAVTVVVTVTTPAAAQSCGVYIVADKQWNSSTADLTISAYGNCSDTPSTYADAHIQVPSGAHGEGNGSGISFAQATAEVSTVGERGFGEFSG